MAEKEDPLNPDKEKQLFERLSMSPGDLEDLEHIRRVMRFIVKKEYAQTVPNQGMPEDDSGTCQAERGSRS